jgi:hypothetical protein
VAYTVSLATIRRRVLQRSNMEDAAANQFVKTPELNDLINGSVAEWVDEVRGTTWNGTYKRSTQSLTTVSGTQTYALATDFLSCLSVDVFIAGSSPVISARPYQEEQRNAFVNLPVMYGWGFASPVFYQLQDTNISFIPIPQGAYSVKVNYVPTAPLLVADTDTIDSIHGWEEFIVLDSAIKVLGKTGSDVSMLEGRLERQRARIREMAPRRDQMTAERVHVIENAGYDEDYW